MMMIGFLLLEEYSKFVHPFLCFSTSIRTALDDNLDFPLDFFFEHIPLFLADLQFLLAGHKISNCQSRN